MTLSPRNLRRSARWSTLWPALSLVLVLGLAGCETLDSINPFSGGGDDLYIDNEDDAPLTEETGSLPADRSNARYSDQDLRAQQP